MSGISISPIELIIKGIPESFLIVLALHVFTNTKINPKKYIFLCLLDLIITYLIRMLPISLGVNTVLSLLILIVLFQIIYKVELSKVVRSIVSAIIIMILLMISEVLNWLLLIIFVGESKAYELVNSTTAIVKSLSTLPSTIIFAILIALIYIMLRSYDRRRKDKNGDSGK